MADDLRARFPGASLAIDFRARTALRLGRPVPDLAALLTCLRTGPSTAIGRGGCFRAVEPNTLRYAYDPITGAPKGLLVQGYAKRLTTYPQDLTNPAWAKQAVAVTPGRGTGVLGLPDAMLVAEAASNTAHVFGQYAACPGGARVTAVDVLEAAGRTLGLTQVIDSTGATVASGYFDVASLAYTPLTGRGGVVPLAPGRCLVWCSAAIAGGATAVTHYVTLRDADGNLAYAGDGASGMLCGYSAVHQTGDDGGPDMPILGNPALAVEHDWDNVSLALAGRDYWAPQRGTVYVEWDMLGTIGAPQIVSLRAPPGGEYMGLAVDTTFRKLVAAYLVGGAYPSLIAGWSGSPGAGRAALRYGPGRTAVVMDGNDIVTGAGIGVPGGLTDLYLGSQGGTASHISGTIGALALYPDPLGDDALCALVD